MTPVPPCNATAAPHLVVESPRPYEAPGLWEAMGDTLRPGGLRLTGPAVEICGFASGARLLDVGCGIGATAAFLTRKGYRVTGVEPSALLLEEARERCPGVELLPGRAEALPFADATFDGVRYERWHTRRGDRARSRPSVAGRAVPARRQEARALPADGQLGFDLLERGPHAPPPAVVRAGNTYGAAAHSGTTPRTRVSHRATCSRPAPVLSALLGDARRGARAVIMVAYRQSAACGGKTDLHGRRTRHAHG